MIKIGKYNGLDALYVENEEYLPDIHTLQKVFPHVVLLSVHVHMGNEAVTYRIDHLVLANNRKHLLEFWFTPLNSKFVLVFYPNCFIGVLEIDPLNAVLFTETNPPTSPLTEFLEDE